MKMTVRGIQLVDYISKKTGNPVKGVTLFCSHKEQGVDGEMTEDVFVSDSLDCARTAYFLKPGILIDVEYNRRGYVADLRVLNVPSKSEEPATSEAPSEPKEPVKKEPVNQETLPNAKKAK